MPPLDLERRWMPYGACRRWNTDLFFPPSAPIGRKPSKALQAEWDKAKSICARCPVLNQCRRDTLGEQHGVWGGLDEFQRFLIRRALPKASKNWPKGRRLALGRMLWNLRTRVDPDGEKTPRVGWTAIREMTGIGPDLGQMLVDEYEAHLKATEKPKPKVVTLPLERAVPPFPKKAGRRDMWVRHNGLMADGWYRGESVDGRRILAEVNAGRHHAQKWVSIDNVRFHHPIPRYVVNEKEAIGDRPTRPHLAQLA